MTVSPTSVTAGSTTNQLGFTFTASTDDTFPTSSFVTLVVPAGWTQPTTTNTTRTAGSCTSLGTLSVTAGSGPWTITVPQTCADGTSFTINYGITGHQITAPNYSRDANLHRRIQFGWR